jgi:serine/threonine protein kinase
MGVALAPERWRRLRPLLDQALDLDAAAREQFLRELSSESYDLRVDLERLIARHQSSAGLSRPAAEVAGPALAVTAPLTDKPAPFEGRRIGPFQLTRMLGAGGMGAVYQGQRVDGGFRQTVAIKLVGGIHPGLTARFGRERQILAELRHPHIAQLLDGGETSDGMPYFAMEYIDGHPITEYADALGLDVDARLRLLIEVAEALAYAHRRNVIHRDIKPNNILVNADGHVKLLDFGIAKLLKGDSGPTLTHQRMGPMTPEYAAPEQFRGGELSAATDVYQFGVLLFRLLAGRLPYSASNDDGLAWARAVSEQEPMSLTGALRDARRAIARNASGEVTLRRFALRRGTDLDAVVRRCLAKAPGARYPSMDALIADLQAYLAPEQRSHRRWRAGPVIAACAALTLLLALGYAWQSWSDTPTTAAAVGESAWSDEPALIAHGLRPENLYTEHPGTIGLIREALVAEGRGDAPAARALLASAHRSDRRSPVPALLSSYWITVLGDDQQQQYWRDQATERLAGLDDPYLDLLAQFFKSDIDDSVEESLRYSSALLAMRSDAWFMRVSRAHALIRRGLRDAALRELQAIVVTRLGHRLLVSAIADRASLGDLEGAWAQFHKLEGAADDPDHAVLRARLTYSSGDLAGARDLYRVAVSRAQSAARFDIESRGLLFTAILTAALGEHANAEPLLRQAQIRLSQRQQFHYAADSALALAQIAALRGDAKSVRTEIDQARTLIANTSNTLTRSQIELFDARLTGASPALPSSPDADDQSGLSALVQARSAAVADDVDAARSWLQRARDNGISDTVFVEEAALLARELGAPAFELRPIDPPFGPYSRYAARLALGAGSTIVPPPAPAPAPLGAPQTRHARSD